MIHTKQLSKYYGKHRGIIEVDLDIKTQEIFGFIGPNGAGKSTMIRTLLGYIKPTSGQATIMGLDVVKERTKILSKIGYMPSESVFYRDVKVKDIIQYSSALRQYQNKRITEDLVKRFDVDTEKKISELSLGNRKKVSIVCAFQHEPQVLFLDEPTSGLDPLMKHEFFKLIRERNQQGATIFYSSHVLSEVQALCERAAFIKEGRIIDRPAFNKIDEVLTRKVHIKTTHPFETIEGMRDIQRRNSDIEFLYHGDINHLLQHLSSSQVYDVVITEPDLEEIFMNYYGVSS